MIKTQRHDLRKGFLLDSNVTELSWRVLVSSLPENRSDPLMVSMYGVMSGAGF
jgi:hypothetical protein